ncbi:amidophosphoribosyltransferase [Candidatus Undinarchaeota archaeon]
MCGIIGIINNKDVSYDVYLGLLSLQHRGQDSCGMYTSDGKNYSVKKGLGLVNDVFDEDNLENVKGNMGIGHVRYPTVGCEFQNDVAPFHTELPFFMALSHNSNLVNYYDLRDELEADGFKIKSGNDAEIMLNLLIQEMSKDKSKKVTSAILFDAVEKMMNRLNGAYSIVCLTKEGLFGFRDPHGIRPMCIGENDHGYAIASESGALDAMGYKEIRDVNPGEAIFISKDLKLETKRIKKAKHAHCMFEYVYFARPDSTIDKMSVYEARANLGRAIAKKWKKKVDMVIPVPDTARTAALYFAEKMGIKYREGFLKNRYVGRTFIMPSQKMREKIVKVKLNPITRRMAKKRVAVIDDSIVRGTTCKKIVNMIKKAYASEVHFISTCPPIKHPCYYGVDFPTEDELIAAKKSIPEIEEEMGADSLTYQDLKSLKSAIRIDGLCTACLDGKYPTEVNKKTKERLKACRMQEREKVHQTNLKSLTYIER